MIFILRQLIGRLKPGKKRQRCPIWWVTPVPVIFPNHNEIAS